MLGESEKVMMIVTTSKMAEIKKNNTRKTAIAAASAAVAGIGLGVGGTFLAKRIIGKRRKAQPQPESQPVQDETKDDEKTETKQPQPETKDDEKTETKQPQPQGNSGNDGDNN